MSTEPIAVVLVPALGAQRPRRLHPGGDPGAPGVVRGTIDVTLRVTADADRRGTTRPSTVPPRRSSCTGRATSSASTPRRSCGPSRATGSRTSRLTTCRSSSSTTRTSLGVTHPPSPRADGPPPAPLADAARARGRRVRRPTPGCATCRCRSSTSQTRRAPSPTRATLWAWAHVHVNGGLGGGPDRPRRRSPRGSRSAVAADRDLAYSRLLSPRILAENTAYHAFLIPTFETGRLAGLGRTPPRRRSATQGAWVRGGRRRTARSIPSTTAGIFRTGDGRGLRVPRSAAPAADGRPAGRAARPSTCSPRELNLPAITELGGVLRLGGALRAPLVTLERRRARRVPADSSSGPSRIPTHSRPPWPRSSTSPTTTTGSR